MAAFCLQLAIPEVWALNGSYAPRCFSPNTLKLNSFNTSTTTTATTIPLRPPPPHAPEAKAKTNTANAAASPAMSTAAAALVHAAGWSQGQGQQASHRPRMGVRRCSKADFLLRNKQAEVYCFCRGDAFWEFCVGGVFFVSGV